MGSAHEAIANADLGLEQWPDPTTAFTAAAGKKTPKLHTSAKCSTLRRASATQTVHSTWGEARFNVHDCPGSKPPTADVGYQRYQLESWLSGSVAWAVRLLDERPLRPGDLTPMFTDLASLDAAVTDPGARAVLARAWALAHQIAQAGADGNDDAYGLALAAAGKYLTPAGKSGVPRRTGLPSEHTYGHGDALRRGWDALIARIGGGVQVARMACLATWSAERHLDPSTSQLRNVRVTPPPGASVGLKDLVVAWRQLFVAEASEYLDYWVELLTAHVAEYDGLPPFQYTGRDADLLRGVWPALDGQPDVVEVPAAVAVTLGSEYDPLRALPASVAWPRSVVDLAINLLDENEISPAQALATAATVAA